MSTVGFGTVVVGIGNPDRGDDAVGIRVIELLEQDPPDATRLAIAQGDLLRMLDHLEGAKVAVLVDAMRSGEEPGTIRRIDVSEVPPRAVLENFASSHSFDLAETVELARSLDRLPPRTVIIGIEAGPLCEGGPLSPAVERALDPAARAVREECGCTKHL